MVYLNMALPEGLYAGVERREFPRVEDNTLLEYSLIKKSVTHISFLKNLGAAGLCFFANEMIEPSSHLYFCLYASGTTKAIKLIGKVIWCRELVSTLWVPRYRAGLQFYDGDSAQYTSLVDMLSASDVYAKVFTTSLSGSCKKPQV